MNPDEQINNPEPLREAQEPSSGTGPFVGAIIIILLMGAGAFYFWNSRSGLVNSNPPPLILGNDTDTSASSSDASADLLPQEAPSSAGSINPNPSNSQNDAVLQVVPKKTK